MATLIGIIHYGDDVLIYNLLSSLSLDKNDALLILNHNLKNTLQFSDSSIRIVHNSRNPGFSVGMNFLISQAIELGFQSFVGINNDMLLKTDSLKNLVSRISGKTIVQGVLIDEFGLGLLARNRINRFCFWVHSIDRHKKYQEVMEDDTDFICAGYFGLDLDEFKKLPLFFDEDFFMYHEDIEWSERLEKAGYFFKVATDALAIHYESSATGGKITWLGIQYRWISLLQFLKKTKKPVLYKFLSISLFVCRMILVWARYGFRWH